MLVTRSGHRQRRSVVMHVMCVRLVLSHNLYLVCSHWKQILIGHQLYSALLRGMHNP